MSSRTDWVTVAVIHRGPLKGDAWLYSDDGLTDDVATNRAFTSLTWAKKCARREISYPIRFVQRDKTYPYYEVQEGRPR